MDLADNQIVHLSGSLAQVHTLRWVNLSGNTMEEVGEGPRTNNGDILEEKSAKIQLDWAQFPAELLELEANGNRILRIRELETGEEDDGGEARRKLKKMEASRDQGDQTDQDQTPPGHLINVL